MKLLVKMEIITDFKMMFHVNENICYYLFKLEMMKNNFENIYSITSH